MKRKISAALVFAIVLVLAMGTVALAAGLGLFGHFSRPGRGQQRRPVWKSWNPLADTYEMTKTAAMPTPAVPVTGETMYDKLLAEQYSHTFELTLDQAYCDGHKLYYSYTLRRSAPMSGRFSAKANRRATFDFTAGGRRQEGERRASFSRAKRRRGLKTTTWPTKSTTVSALATARNTPDGE